MSSATAATPAPADLVLQLSTGYVVSAALYAATKLGIPDLLQGGPRAVKDLAAASKANEDALYRTLRALSGAGIFRETTSRMFELTPSAECLCSNAQNSMRDVVLWIADPFHFRIYAETPHALETGKTVVERVTKMPIFDYFAQDKEESEVFNRAMTNFSAAMIPAVLEAYDFSYLNGKTLVDVAGGHGYVLTAILQKYRQMKGVLFDLERVVAGAGPRIQKVGLADRCSTVSGDFFKAVPAGDAYVMKHIIHDWDDEQALTILQCCHRAGAKNAKVILIETVIAAGNEPHMGKWLDIEMLLLPGGRERTEEEFRALLARAGFRLTRVVPTKSAVCVIEAEKT
jgi:O-methyltransferase domain/Dimerisation domain